MSSIIEEGKVQPASAARDAGAERRTSMLLPLAGGALVGVVLWLGVSVVTGATLLAAATSLVKFLHIVAGIVGATGMLGREFAIAQARKSVEIQTVFGLVGAAGRFENLMVIPGSMAVGLFGIALTWLQGWPWFGFLEGSRTTWLPLSILLYLAFYPLVIFIFVPKGKIFGAELERARAEGSVTTELTAAFNDKAVHMAHLAELALVAAILYLMIAKPF